MKVDLTCQQFEELAAIAKGGWKAGRSSEVTMHRWHTLNLSTARAFIRKGLVYSPRHLDSNPPREASDVYPGHPIEITQAGRDLLAGKESSDAQPGQDP